MTPFPNLVVLATFALQAVGQSSANSGEVDLGDIRRQVENEVPRFVDIHGMVLDTAPDVSEENFAQLEKAKSGEEFRMVVDKMFGSRPVANTKVVLEGRRGKLETITDAKGQFSFKSVPDRRRQYLVVEIIPTGGNGEQIASVRKVWDSNYSSAIVLEPRVDLITIKGRVVDAHGQAIAGARVTGQDADYLETGPLPEVRETKTKADGSYELSGFKPADIYVIGSYLAGGGHMPNTKETHFGALIQVKADGFEGAQMVVPLLSERQLIPARRFLKTMIKINASAGQVIRDLPKEPTLLVSRGDVITGADIVLKQR